MRVLSLFSGGGLGDFGLELAGMEIVGQVEIDEYCQKILRLRWPDVPKWRDIKSVTGKEVLEKCGRIDLVSGGFPCQDVSNLNQKGKGIDGVKSGLWKEMYRIVCQVLPRYVLVENATALLGKGMGTVLGDLATVGYDAEWDCLPASSFGAPHVRDRLWIVANSDSARLQTCLQARDFRASNTQRKRMEPSRPSYGDFPTWNPSEPNVGRVAHGVANRVDRLKLLGNGQVVQVVEWIGKRIMEFDSAFPEKEGK